MLVQRALPTLAASVCRPRPPRVPRIRCHAHGWEHPLDRLVETALPAGRIMPLFPWVGPVLSPSRRMAADKLVAWVRPQIEPLVAGVQARDPAAVARYDGLVADAVGRLRRPHGPGLRGLLAAFDAGLYHDGQELSDSPTLSMAQRQHVLGTLNRVNILSGNYDRFADLLAPLRASAPRPARVMDLAAGTGGYALNLAQRLGDAVEVVATDIVPDFLTLGAAEAARVGIAVRFARQDALDMSNLPDRSVDIITCHQSLHHFGPGPVGRMLGEALRTANVGVCLVDGERDIGLLTGMACLMAVYGRSYPVVHDTVVSVRRMFNQEELELVARLAPVDPATVRVETGRLAPSHVYVRAQRLS